MATIIVPLKHGLKVGEDVLTEAELREATAGDVIEAQEESEKLVITPQGVPMLVSSPILVGVGLLRRQIKRIGNLNGPLALGEIKRLNPEDLDLLQKALDKMDQAAGEAVSDRGRDAGVGW